MECHHNSSYDLYTTYSSCCFTLAGDETKGIRKTKVTVSTRSSIVYEWNSFSRDFPAREM